LTINKQEETQANQSFCSICGVAITPENKTVFKAQYRTLAFDTELALNLLDTQVDICRSCYAKSKTGQASLSKNTLKKDEILSLRKVIGNTFEKRESITQYPFKIFINETSLPSNYPVQALFTVPKRNFKLAVKRNLLRRRIKEAYRQHKHELYEHLNQENKQLAIVIIYIHNKEMTYNDIEEKLILSLQKVIKKISRA